MLRYVKITNDNIILATKIQMQIFPDECAYKHYKDVIDKNIEYQNYYLVYDDDTIIGITGLYSFEDISVTNSIWLGWYGILKKYRKKRIWKRCFIRYYKHSKRIFKKISNKIF